MDHKVLGLKVSIEYLSRDATFPTFFLKDFVLF